MDTYKGVSQTHALYVDQQPPSKSWHDKISPWLVTSSLLTCYFALFLKVLTIVYLVNSLLFLYVPKLCKHFLNVWYKQVKFCQYFQKFSSKIWICWSNLLWNGKFVTWNLIKTEYEILMHQYLIAVLMHKLKQCASQCINSSCYHPISTYTLSFS